MRVNGAWTWLDYAVAMETALVVAIVAALASLGGAAWAGKSARRASRSAERTNSLNHQIAGIDRDREELAIAYKRVLEAMVSPALKPILHGERMAAIELLFVCNGTDDRLKDAVQAVVPFAPDGETAGLNAAMAELSMSYQAAQYQLATKRRVALGDAVDASRR